jgi:hypothetical protein
MGLLAFLGLLGAPSKEKKSNRIDRDPEVVVRRERKVPRGALAQMVGNMTVHSRAWERRHDTLPMKKLLAGASYDDGNEPVSPDDFDPQDLNQRTALIRAASIGHVEAVRALLNRGADPDAHAKMMDTPLIAAARGAVLCRLGSRMSNHTTVVQMLLAAGAHPCTRDLSGATCFSVAMSSGMCEMVELLLCHPRFSCCASQRKVCIAGARAAGHTLLAQRAEEALALRDAEAQLREKQRLASQAMHDDTQLQGWKKEYDALGRVGIPDEGAGGKTAAQSRLLADIMADAEASAGVRLSMGAHARRAAERKERARRKAEKRAAQSDSGLMTEEEAAKLPLKHQPPAYATEWARAQWCRDNGRARPKLEPVLRKPGAMTGLRMGWHKESPMDWQVGGRRCPPLVLLLLLL